MLELYKEADKLNTTILTGCLPHAKALCIPGYIALDYSLVGTVADERVHTAHELGHCATESFYTKRDPDYIVQRYENRTSSVLRELFFSGRFFEVLLPLRW